MDLIKAQQLEPFRVYNDKRLKLKIIHFCPVFGDPNDPMCKRIVITTDVTQTDQSDEHFGRHLIVTFFGSYAKTPFKKSSLKTGQLITLENFETNIMPNHKVIFKAEDKVLKNFFKTSVSIKKETNPIIKMIISVREDYSESHITPLEDNGLESNSSEETEVMNDDVNEPKICNTDNTPSKRPISVRKRIEFDDSDEETIITSDDDIDVQSKRVLKSSNNQNYCSKSQKCGKTTIKTLIISPKKNGTEENDSTESHGKYEYKTLIELHRLLPVSHICYINIYGVLQKRDLKTINLFDETVHTVTVHLRQSTNSSHIYPNFKTGDLIRIHRLLLNPNTTDMTCIHPRNMVIFEAFQENGFKPITNSLNPTFDEFDRKRKSEIDEWFADHLLNNSLNEVKDKPQEYTDIAVQVLRCFHIQNRTILEVWDTSVPSFKTFVPDISLTGSAVDEQHEELLRIVHENNMSIFITLFDEHSIDASYGVKPMDIIVLFNIKIKKDLRNLGLFNLTLNSGYRFGKCMRFVNKDSYLGKQMLERIEQYVIMSATNTATSDIPTDLDLIHFPDLSQPMGEIDECLSETYEMNLHLDETEIGNISFEEITDEDLTQDEIQRIAIINELNQNFLPSDILVEIPDKDIFISELSKQRANHQIFKVKARVNNYLPSNQYLDVISILCINKECHRIISLREAIAEDPNVQSMIGRDSSEMVYTCAQCKQNSGLFVFKIQIMLQDIRRDQIVAELFGHNAELFFKSKPEDIVRYPTNWCYIENVLSFICPKVSSLDSPQNNNQAFYWVLQSSKINDQNEFIYLIRTALEIQTSNKLIGTDIM